jgi:hypothetical protein
MASGNGVLSGTYFVVEHRSLLGFIAWNRVVLSFAIKLNTGDLVECVDERDDVGPEAEEIVHALKSGTDSENNPRHGPSEQNTPTSSTRTA